MVLGIYLTDVPNKAAHLIGEFSNSKRHQVTQIWVAIGKEKPPSDTKEVTALHTEEFVPKFVMLNRLLKQIDIDEYDFILITDDDIEVQPGFLDAYFSWVERYGFSIAQPARTQHSYRHHKLTLQRPLISARETRFVEIGPVFSFNRRAAETFLPFDEETPMGWGLDYFWPAIARKKGMKLGIIDKVTVDHSYRPQAATYSIEKNRNIMNDFLSSRPHLKHNEAMKTLRWHIF